MRNSNMWDTLKVFAHTAGPVSQSRDDPGSREHSASLSLPHIGLCTQRQQRLAAAPSECRNTRRWKLIWNHFILSVPWFHFCRKVTDWNIGLKWHAVRLTGGTHRTRDDYINNLPTSHTISMHTCWSTGRGGGEYKSLHQINFFFFVFSQNTKHQRTRRDGKEYCTD